MPSSRSQSAKAGNTGNIASAHLDLSSRSLQHWVAIGIALLAIAIRAFVSWRTHSTGEDALITLRYAKNLAAGQGFTYNPPERVLGVTTPLFTLLLSVFYRAHLPAMLLGKACNIAADGVTCYLIARLFARKEIGKPVEGLFACALYAVTTTPISVSISGMETALVTCVGFAMVYAYVAKRAYWLYSLGAILFLLRIDGLLLFAILGAALAIRERKLLLRPAAIALIIALPWIIYSVAYFGSPIPESLIAKITVYGHPSFQPHSGRITTSNMYAFEAQFASGIMQIAVTLLFILGVIVIAAKAVCRDACGLLIAPVLWCAIYFGVMLFSRVPAFPWYFLPPWPLVITVAVLAAATAPMKAAKLFPDLAARWAAGAVPVSLAVLLMFGIVHLHSVLREVGNAQRVEDEVRKPIGIWLRSHMLPGERVMLEPIGYIGYYSQARVLDTIGLVSPEVLDSYRKSDIADPRADVIFRLKPQWLCLRASEESALLNSSGRKALADYEPVQSFGTPGSERFEIYHVRQDSSQPNAH